MGEVIISIDFETTGLSTSKDRIVEYALVKEVNGARTRLSSLVNPEIPIPTVALNIHHISDEMVKLAKPFREHAAAIVEFLTVGATLCGHNFWRFDLPLSQAELVRANCLPIDITKYIIVDSLILFRKMEPHTLSKAVEFYCHEPLAGAHRAAHDAEAALNVYLGQRQCYDFKSDLLAATMCGTNPNSNLKSLPNEPTLNDAKLISDKLTFGKYKGKTLLELSLLDVPYLRWLKRMYSTPSPFQTQLTKILESKSNKN